jgi:hypothetical protein
LTPEEFEQVLCHELAHLRRFDDWTQLLHAIAQSLLFFHPAVYWIGRRLRTEREIACDDWVVSSTGNPRPYAGCLVRLHELTRYGAAPSLAPGAVARKQITRRVEALLAPDRNRSQRLCRSGWVAAGVLVAAAGLVSTAVAPPFGVELAPVQTLPVAQLSLPGAPPIHFAPRPQSKVERAPLLAARRPRPAEPAASTAPAAKMPDAGYVLVEWRVEPHRQYLFVTVFEVEAPSPAPQLNQT